MGYFPQLYGCSVLRHTIPPSTHSTPTHHPVSRGCSAHTPSEPPLHIVLMADVPVSCVYPHDFRDAIIFPGRDEARHSLRDLNETWLYVALHHFPLLLGHTL